MNTLVLQSLGWALIHLLWQGALVALALAVALRVVDRRAASSRYLLSCGALALLLVLPVLTAWRHASLWSPAESDDAPVARTNASPPPAPTSPLLLVPPPTSLPERASVAVQALSAMSEHMPWLVLTWGVGVVVSSLRLLSGGLRLHRLVHEAEPAPAEWQHSLDRLAKRLGMRRPVRLLRSVALDVPAAVGWLRPAVLLPVATLAGLPVGQLEMVLAHELAHLRRHDFVVNLVQTMVETLLFYHPAVWWISRVIRAEREHCCDDIAVGIHGNPVSYARALTALETLREPTLQVASPALSALGGSLTDRVRRLVGAPARRCSSRWAGASVVTLLGGLAVATPLAVLALPAHSGAPLAATALPSAPAVFVQTSAPALPEQSERPSAPMAPSEPVRLAQAPVPVPIPVPVPAQPKVSKPTSRDEEGPDNDNDNDNDNDDDHEKDDVRVDSAQLTVGQLVALKTAGVTPERVKDLESLGYEPTVGNLVQFGHADISPEYVKEMTGVLGHKPTADELVELKHLGVNAERAKALAALAGKGTLSSQELTEAAALGMDEAFVRELRDAGYDKLPFSQLTELRAIGVNAKYIQALKAAGYDKLPPEQLTEFKAVGVSPEYLRSLREAGFNGLSAREVVELRAVGVTPEFIRKMREGGLDTLTVDELVRLRASGVDADFLRALRQKK